MIRLSALLISLYKTNPILDKSFSEAERQRRSCYPLISFADKLIQNKILIVKSAWKADRGGASVLHIISSERNAKHFSLI